MQRIRIAAQFGRTDAVDVNVSACDEAPPLGSDSFGAAVEQNGKAELECGMLRAARRRQEVHLVVEIGSETGSYALLKGDEGTIPRWTARSAWGAYLVLHQQRGCGR